MLKYGQINKAIDIFNTARSKNMILSVGVYNNIILNVANISDSENWNYVLVSNSKKKKNISHSMQFFKFNITLTFSYRIY